MRKGRGRRDQGLADRLGRLYGQGDYEAGIRNYRRRRRRMILLGCGILFMTLALRAALPQAGGMQLETDESGNVLSIKRPAESSGPALMTLTAIAGHGEDTLVQSVTISVVPEGNAAFRGPDDLLQEPGPEQKTRMAVQKTVFRLGRDAQGDRLLLPDTLESGETLQWRPASRSSSAAFVLLAALVLPLLAGIPGRKLKQEEQAAARSIQRELPGFVNKLVLLMDSGMVLDASLRKIAGGGSAGKSATDYFYGQLGEIARECGNTNKAIHLSLQEFAQRSGRPEFIRLTNLISDGTKKGVDLMALLSMERDNLWFARKKAAEQQGRMAETKLTLPLVILLLVLVMVTITPALLEM